STLTTMRLTRAGRVAKARVLVILSGAEPLAALAVASAADASARESTPRAPAVAPRLRPLIQSRRFMAVLSSSGFGKMRTQIKFDDQRKAIQIGRASCR